MILLLWQDGLKQLNQHKNKGAKTSMDLPKWKSETQLSKEADSSVKPLKIPLSRSASLSSLKAVKITDEMRRHIAQLKSDVESERNVARQMKRERVLDIKRTKEEEFRKYQQLLKEMELAFQKEKQKEITKETDLLQKQFNQEIKRITKLKDDEILRERKNWSQDRENLILQITDKTKQETSEKVSFAFEKMRAKLENDILCLQQENGYLEEELLVCRNSESRRVDENRKIYQEHQMEIENLKKEAMQDSKKQVNASAVLYSLCSPCL